jgi:hypothetical protein
MGIDHSSLDIFVTKKFLNRTNIIPILKKMGSKRMTKTMAGGMFGNAYFLRLRQRTHNTLLFLQYFCIILDFMVNFKYFLNCIFGLFDDYLREF